MVERSRGPLLVRTHAGAHSSRFFEVVALVFNMISMHNLKFWDPGTPSPGVMQTPQVTKLTG